MFRNKKAISAVCIIMLITSIISGLTASAAYIEQNAPAVGKVWNLRDDFYAANATGSTSVNRTTFGGSVSVPYFTGGDLSSMVPFADSYSNSGVWNIGFNSPNAIQYQRPTTANCNIDDTFGVAVTAFSTAKSHIAFIGNNYSNPGYENAIHGQVVNGSDAYVYWTSPVSGTVNLSMLLNRITAYRLTFSAENVTTGVSLINAQELSSGSNSVGVSATVSVGDQLKFTFTAPGTSAVNSATASQFIINKFEISEKRTWDFQRDMYEGLILPSKYAANSEYAQSSALAVSSYSDSYGNSGVYSVEFIAENDEGTEVVLSPSSFVTSARAIAAMYPAAYKYETRTTSPYSYSYVIITEDTTCVYDDENNSVTASAKIYNGLSDTQNIMFILALYDGEEGNQVATNIEYDEELLPEEEHSFSVTASTDEEYTYARIFIWENETIRPYFPSKGLPIER